MNNLPAWMMRTLTIGLPPLALLILCAVVVPRHQKLNDVRAQTVTTNAGIRDYLAQLNSIRSLPPDPTVATLPMTKEEQSQFLRGLSRLCNGTGNRLQSISSLAAPAGARGGTGSLPADTLEIRSTLTFEGSFSTLRRFLNGLKTTRRLIALADCKVGAAHNGLPNIQVSLTITRYVDAPAQLPAAAPATKS